MVGLEMDGVGGGVGHHGLCRLSLVGALGWWSRGVAVAATALVGAGSAVAGAPAPAAGAAGAAAPAAAPGMVPPFEATQAANCAAAHDLDRDRHIAVAGAAQLGA